MPRYFFDTHDGIEVRDEIGQEIVDQASLRAEALIVASERSAAVVKRHELYAVVVTVRDSENATVLTLRLAVQVDDPRSTSLPSQALGFDRHHFQ